MNFKRLQRKYKLTPFTEYFLYANYSVTSVMILLDKSLVSENDAIISVIGVCFSIFAIKFYSKYFSNSVYHLKQILGVFIVIPVPVILLLMTKQGVISSSNAYQAFEILSLITIGIIIFFANVEKIGTKSSSIKSLIGVALYFTYFEGLEFLKTLVN